MISRRLVRIKALQALYSFQQGNSVSDFDWAHLTVDQITPLDKSKENLSACVCQSHDFFLFLLDLPYQLSQHLIEKRAIEKSKYFPDTAKIRDLSLLDRMPLIKYLHIAIGKVENPQFPFVWSELSKHFDTWYEWMNEWEFVRDISIFDDPSFDQQQVFLEEFYASLFETREAFFDALSEYYPSWGDDELYTTREIEKTLQGATENGYVPISDSPTKNTEDIEMALLLFGITAKNNQVFEAQVAEITDNWDPSRIAVMDMLIIKLALAEFLYFPTIPPKVTINEYLEITKNYSTPNSSRFVNGVLDKLRIVLDEQGLIKKIGRGLREK
ncbi:MAG: transcription antitermination protein NusB [Flavobacteriaceae bacterium]|nr:transcription antitermination protein NusB [Flavobacteriaceae bacterium]